VYIYIYIYICVCIYIYIIQCIFKNKYIRMYIYIFNLITMYRGFMFNGYNNIICYIVGHLISDPQSSHLFADSDDI
jgi:hypothetical protein